MTGRTTKAVEALAIGLVDRAVGDGRWTNLFLLSPPRSLSSSETDYDLINSAGEVPLDKGLLD